MTRMAIPNRRECETICITWGAHRFHVSAGYHDGGLVEVFYADGMKSGTDLLHMAQDACVLISMLLQHGETIESIGKSLSGASIVSAIVAAIGGGE